MKLRTAVLFLFLIGCDGAGWDCGNHNPRHHADSSYEETYYVQKYGCKDWTKNPKPIPREPQIRVLEPYFQVGDCVRVNRKETLWVRPKEEFTVTEVVKSTTTGQAEYTIHHSSTTELPYSGITIVGVPESWLDFCKHWRRP